MGLLSTIGAASGRAFGLTRVGAAIRDAYFNLTTLLLPGNGTNGAQNNTFLDSSTNNFTITRNGNTTQGTFTPFSQTGWSNYFNGSTDYLTSSHPALNATFTIEAWVYRTSGSANQSIVFLNSGGVSGVVVYIDGSNYLVCTDGVTGQAAFSNLTVPINAWAHVAVVRSGGTTTGYVNGTVAGSHSFTPSAVNAATIARYTGASPLYFPGYISNVRVVNGTAVYTSAFTPPTSPLTAITNTSLLTCQSNRFIDNSTNAFAITTVGTPSVQAFSPFAPTAAYSAATVGGSGYFDGSGDYLQTPSNAALGMSTGDFTIECWYYQTSRALVNTIIAPSTDNLNIYINTSGILGFYDGVARNSSITVPLNTWNHIALVRSGSTATLYYNGVSAVSQANTTNYATASWYIGRNSSGTDQCTGYCTSARIVKGQALTSGTFTPPTAPVTTSSVGWTGANAASSITGSVNLLLNFTNAGITDATAKNDLETVGDAQISTTQSKWGGSSMYFDGTGDALIIPRNNWFLPGANTDFTLECWVYLTATPGVQGAQIFGAQEYGLNGDWHLSINSSLQAFLYMNSTLTSYTNTTQALTTNAWYHVAVSRSGTGSNNLKIFVSGIGASFSVNNTLVSIGGNNFSIGADQNGDEANLTGYIDDLRFTLGYARYTANFTPPTAAFPLQ